MKNKKEGRIPTGIPGFDKIVQGGFVEDSLNLVMGNAGSGKTTFLLQFLYNGATRFNQKGLYVSFEPEISHIYKASRLQGMNFEKLEEKGKCKILKMPSGTPIKKMQKQLMKMIVEEDIERICLDPINVFSISLPSKANIRKQIYDFLSFLRSLGVCVLIAGESGGVDNGGLGFSEDIKFTKYLVDSVVELFSSGIAGEGDRALRVAKMRMTNHIRQPYPLEINNKGVTLNIISDSEEDEDEFVEDILQDKNSKKKKKKSKK